VQGREDPPLGFVFDNIMCGPHHRDENMNKIERTIVTTMLEEH
jgi:hypothetical protein